MFERLWIDEGRVVAADLTPAFHLLLDDNLEARLARGETQSKATKPSRLSLVGDSTDNFICAVKPSRSGWVIVSTQLGPIGTGEAGPT